MACFCSKKEFSLLIKYPLKAPLQHAGTRQSKQLVIVGVLSNHRGHVVRTFSKHTRMGLTIEAEILALLEGLCITI